MLNDNAKLGDKIIVISPKFPYAFGKIGKIIWISIPSSKDSLYAKGKTFHTTCLKNDEFLLLKNLTEDKLKTLRILFGFHSSGIK